MRALFVTLSFFLSFNIISCKDPNKSQANALKEKYANSNSNDNAQQTEAGEPATWESDMAMEFPPDAMDADQGVVASFAAAGVNLCRGQPANTFQCIDDTNFQHCTGNSNFVVNACPRGFCATRTPSNKNPCVGRAEARRVDGVEPPAAGKASPPPPPKQANAGGQVRAPQASPPQQANNNGQCVGGPKFDPAGAKNVGNGRGIQFIGGQCRSSRDCASGCCAKPCGICSGVGAQFQAGKQGCGFGG